MKAYIITIVLCMILCIISDVFMNKKKYKTTVVFMSFAVTALCLLAAFRSEYVGRDVHTYLTILFDDFSKGTSLIAEIQSTHAGGIEPLFMLLVYLTSGFGSLNVVFFFIQLAVTLPVFIYGYKTKKEDNVPISLTTFIFLMTMYVYSFSMMRQSIAISFCLLSLHYYKKKNNKISFLLLLIAFLFHRTALIMLLIMFLYRVSCSSKRNSALSAFIVLMVSVLAGALLRSIVSILPSKYSIYLGGSFDTSFNVASLFKKCIPLVISLIFSVKALLRNSGEKNLLLFSFFLAVYDILFYFFGLNVSEISRICLYFTDILYFTFAPIVIRKVRPIAISATLLVVMLSVFWVHMLVINNEADTYPYKSDVMPVLNG